MKHRGQPGRAPVRLSSPAWLALALAILGWTAPAVFAQQTDTWVGNESPNWSAAANWTFSGSGLWSICPRLLVNLRRFGVLPAPGVS